MSDIFTGFSNIFGNFMNASNAFIPNPAGTATQPNSKTPPASQRALRTLPMVKVTADDILEATNKECLICLEEQQIGAWACKLQCGHLFHKPCVTDWLEKHCTCPVCRFELETDDQSYETDRKKRMKKRKLRLRLDEINNKSIAQLRELASVLNVNITGCLDKTEVVDKLVKSGCIEVTEGLPPMEMYESELNGKSVKELKYLLLSFGLPATNALEKRELREQLVASGRIIFKPELKISAEDEAVMQNGSSSNSGSSGSSGGSSAGSMDIMNIEMTVNNNSESTHPGDGIAAAPADGRYHVLLSDLQASSLSELRELCAQFGVVTTGCIDKSDIVQCLVDSENVQILPVDEQLEAKADHGTFSVPSTGSPSSTVAASQKKTGGVDCSDRNTSPAESTKQRSPSYYVLPVAAASTTSLDCAADTAAAAAGEGKAGYYELPSAASAAPSPMPAQAPTDSGGAQSREAASSSSTTKSGAEDPPCTAGSADTADSMEDMMDFSESKEEGTYCTYHS